MPMRATTTARTRGWAIIGPHCRRGTWRARTVGRHRWTSGARLRGYTAGSVLGLVVLLAGCANILDQNRQAAINTARSRAQFELKCPDLEASILSQKTIEELRRTGTEYTIGVRGCGRQAVYLTYCRTAEDCNAVAQTGRVERAPGPARRPQ